MASIIKKKMASNPCGNDSSKAAPLLATHSDIHACPYWINLPYSEALLVTGGAQGEK